MHILDVNFWECSDVTVARRSRLPPRRLEQRLGQPGNDLTEWVEASPVAAIASAVIWELS
jgi:hypothetical protein